MATASLTLIRFRYPTRRALLSSARAHGAELSLFVPGSADVPVGTKVTLDITLGDSVMRFALEGKVNARRAAQLGLRQEAGLGVVFDGEHKRAAAQMLAECAGRSLDDGTALDTRKPVEVTCLVNFGGRRLKAAVKDVSNTGAFIGTPKIRGLRKDAELTIRISPIFGRWGGQLLNARVMWVGEKKGIGGFGVRFLDQSAHVRQSLKKHLGSIAP